MEAQVRARSIVVAAVVSAVCAAALSVGAAVASATSKVSGRAATGAKELAPASGLSCSSAPTRQTIIGVEGRWGIGRPCAGAPGPC